MQMDTHLWTINKIYQQKKSALLHAIKKFTTVIATSHQNAI